MQIVQTEATQAEEHYQKSQKQAQDIAEYSRQRIQNLRLKHQQEHEDLERSLAAGVEQVQAFQKQEHKRRLTRTALIQAVSEVNKEILNNPKEQMMFLDDLLYKMYKNTKK